MPEADAYISREVWEEVIKDAELANRKPGRDIIWYVYETKHGGKQLRGAVCRDKDGHLGYSWAHKKDLSKVTKKRTRQIAFARAAKCDVYRFMDDWYRGRNGFKTYIPRELYLSLQLLQEGAA